MNIKEAALNAKRASKSLMTIGTQKKNEALAEICKALRENADYILKENEKDLIKAKEKGMSSSLTDRLRLTTKRIDSMIEGVEKIIALDDPIGETLGAKQMPNGIKVS